MPSAADRDLCATCGNQFPAGHICDECRTSLARASLYERWLTWRYGRKYGELCRAYGGTMTNGSVRICEKRRGHLDSHLYEFENVLSARYGIRERTS